MTYKEAISLEMEALASDEKVVFLGEGLVNAGRVYGTLDKVPTSRCIEMPIAENLIVGCAMGLALAGFKPVVIFQRMDFMLTAADAIINHLAKAPELSGFQFNFSVVIRAIIGSQDPKFDVGAQHKGDYRKLFSDYLPVWDYTKQADKQLMYLYALQQGFPVIVVEQKDLYEKEV